MIMHSNGPVLVVVVLCLIKLIQSHAAGDEMDIVFRERTYADWARIWHQESHSRCREKLVRHLDWACEKDIYKLTRRTSEESGGGGYDGDGDDDGDTGKAANSLFKMNVRKKSVINPWLPAKEVAGQMLRTRRNGAKGITNECCTRAGCTWEEYAEYCPSNKRRHV